ncbi:hypothetical protein [Rufibacter latericius]|uniref:Uncharacterized protein n=1 Tax=Rufibacter latericius TaxID=2487040 RepID=A0A3M9MD30_9BACT|nr:hypothetical protein [Rufibacter latericius]RNI23115.1 hypothetical protein EFB08_19550 [Rufibacter latericius]
MEDYTHLVHDCEIDKLSLDFNTNTTNFLISCGDDSERMKVTFEGVINQDFRIIDKGNIIFGIEETDWKGLQLAFPDLMSYYKHYKSISTEDQKRIESRALKCFHISSSAGLDGYIIAESINFEKITPANMNSVKSQ